MKDLKICLVFCFCAIHVCAQDFSASTPSEDTLKRPVYLLVKADNFLKNNEYFSPLSEGWTGIGFFVQPQIEYKPDQKTTIDAGFHLLMYDGGSFVSEFLPLFSISYEAKPGFLLRMGHLNNDKLHYLSESLYRRDWFYQHPVEYGLQSIVDKAHFHSDTWLEWRRFIQKGDPFQEKIIAGSSSRMEQNLGKHFSVHVPFQLLLTHKGGQIDTSPDGVLTVFNGMAGIGFSFKPYPLRTFNFGVDAQYLYYQALSMPPPGQINALPFQKGYAWNAGINASTKWFDLKMAYQQGYQFIAPYGEFLLESISELDSSFTMPKRKLIIGRIELSKSLSHYLQVKTNFEAYYDLPSKRMDFTYGVNLIVDDRFFLFTGHR